MSDLVPTLRAVTKYGSLEHFVTSFAPFVDESSIFIATRAPLEPGTERRFVFQLADGTAVRQGRGRVVEPGPRDGHVGEPLGMRLGFMELTPKSREIHRALLAAQKPAAHPHPNTVPRHPSPSPATTPMPPQPVRPAP